MQFEHTWEKVLSGEKTQTRRLALPEPDGTGLFDCEILRYPNGKLSVCRLKKGETEWKVRYQVGQTHAVVPKRGKSAIWIDSKGNSVEPVQYRGEYTAPDHEWQVMRIDKKEYYKEKGFYPARIRITAIRREDVRQISDDDAKAEGFESKEDFWYTWVEMHDKYFLPKFRYANDAGSLLEYGFFQRPAKRYDAWVLEFELAALAG